MRDGVNVSGANSSSFTTGVLSLLDSGASFAVVVWNAFPPAAQSELAILTVSNRSRPVLQNFTAVSLNSSDVGNAYSGGQVILYRASAVDEVQGQLPPTSFSWSIEFHHQTHTHPFLVRFYYISTFLHFFKIFHRVH